MSKFTFIAQDIVETESEKLAREEKELETISLTTQQSRSAQQ